jgi:hypothetical protein
MVNWGAFGFCNNLALHWTTRYWTPVMTMRALYSKCSVPFQCAAVAPGHYFYQPIWWHVKDFWQPPICKNMSLCSFQLLCPTLAWLSVASYLFTSLIRAQNCYFMFYYTVDEWSWLQMFVSFQTPILVILRADTIHTTFYSFPPLEKWCIVPITLTHGHLIWLILYTTTLYVFYYWF